MNILYLSARFPFPPDRGDRLTAFHLLRVLSRRHRVTLLSFEDGHEPPEAKQEVAKVCERIETVRLSRRYSWTQAWLGVASAVPSQVSYYASRAMLARTAELCSQNEFDGVFVHLFRMAPYGSACNGNAKVLFLADSIALSLRRSMRFQPWWKRPAIAWECRRVSRYEIEVAQRFDKCWVLSDVDRNDLVARGCDNVEVVTHGVNERLFELPLAPKSGPAVFLGNLSVPHNVDAALFLVREVWPRVLARVPGARLELVGAEPTPAIRALDARPGVSVVGPVPDLFELWARAAVLVAPLRFSTGIQNKVLEGMAAGIPVVTTAQVADGIGATGLGVLRVGSDARALAHATAEILQNPSSVDRMIDDARRFVGARFDWENVATRFESLVSSKRTAVVPGV